jgi:hypothetical protein
MILASPCFVELPLFHIVEFCPAFLRTKKNPQNDDYFISDTGIGSV